MDVLDLRQLNRATLARQHLLERAELGVAQLVHAVGGLQAQTPGNPVVSTWSRLDRFERADLVEAIASGELVRGTTLRGTLHLHHVDEYRAIRMTLQPTLDSLVNSMHRRIRDEDLEPAAALGLAMIEQQPRTIGELKQAFQARFPDSETQALGTLVRYRTQLLMVPDLASPNGYPNLARFAPARELVGDTLDATVDPGLVLRRFLGVLGPGSTRDAQVWSGVRGLGPVARELLERGALVEVMSHDGQVLLDLPDMPRVDDDVRAGVRFLPMWDNLLLSHADRSRVIDPRHKPWLASKNGMPPATFLVDGFVHGTWKLEAGELRLTPFARTSRADQDELVAEGTALLELLEPHARSRRVRFD
jgi:hypothetical protein